MKTRAEIIAEEYTEEYVFQADGLDEAIIGWDEKGGRLVYSVRKCIGILSRGMTEDEAKEYFFFNVEGAYVGEKTPVWCHDEFFE
jgi:hypothetical protein